MFPHDVALTDPSPAARADASDVARMIYTHVLNRGGRDILSPLDRLPEGHGGVPAHVNPPIESG